MKNFLRNFGAGLFSIMCHIAVVITSCVAGAGFSSLHKLSPWTAILWFIALLILSGINILCIYLLGTAARGKTQLVGNKETEENKK